jgi:hypothetical protein
MFKMQRRGSFFVMEEPTIERIRQVVAMGANQKTMCIIGTVNIEAMKTVFVLAKLFSVFLRTHVYSAFRHNEDVLPTRMEDSYQHIRKKRKVSGSSYLACIQDSDNVENPDDETEYKGQSTPTDVIELQYARPTLGDIAGWGSYDTIPNSSGLFVPFVRELAVSDSTTVPALLEDYFIRSLSESREGMLQKIDELRSGWGLICSTRLGDEVSHMAKCVDIALRAQCRIYPIYSDTIYEGSVICGAGYTISALKTVYEPIAFADLQGVVRDSSAHARSIQEIVAAVNDPNVNIRGCTTMRQLSTILKGVELDAMTQDTIVKAAMHLSYPNKYWSTAGQNVKKAMVLLVDDDNIPDDYPMHPTYIFSTDRVGLILSAFGHEGPTFLIPNGKKIELDVAEPPENFTVRTVSTNVAISDMKYMMESGFVTNDVGNLSGKHRDTPLKGQIKKDVWSCLSDYWKTQSRKPAARTVSMVVRGRSTDDDLW